MAALDRGVNRVMAKGASDWVARTDILLQTLQELIIRNKYGLIYPATYYNYVNAAGPTLLLSVSGKGNIYWAGLVVTSTGIQENDYAIITIDAISIQVASFRDAFDFGSNTPRLPGSFVDCLDNVNFKYGAFLGANITFESTLTLTYIETYGRTPLVLARAIQALV